MYIDIIPNYISCTIKANNITNINNNNFNINNNSIVRLFDNLNIVYCDNSNSVNIVIILIILLQMTSLIMIYI